MSSTEGSRGPKIPYASHTLALAIVLCAMVGPSLAQGPFVAGQATNSAEPSSPDDVRRVFSRGIVPPDSMSEATDANPPLATPGDAREGAVVPAGESPIGEPFST